VADGKNAHDPLSSVYAIDDAKTAHAIFKPSLQLAVEGLARVRIVGERPNGGSYGAFDLGRQMPNNLANPGRDSRPGAWH